MAAYDPARLNVNAGGMASAGDVAVYDASGTNDQGGAAFSTAGTPPATAVNGYGYFPYTRKVGNVDVVTEIGAAVDQAMLQPQAGTATEGKKLVDEAGNGTGLAMRVLANNRQFMDVLYRNGTKGAASAQLRFRRGSFGINIT